MNDGNPPSALPLPISPDLEEPALLPNSAQGLGTHGQLPPLGPAPPSNLTPSLAQGGQPYSAAQQVNISACPNGSSVPCCGAIRLACVRNAFSQYHHVSLGNIVMDAEDIALDPF